MRHCKNRARTGLESHQQTGPLGCETASKTFINFEIWNTRTDERSAFTGTVPLRHEFLLDSDCVCVWICRMEQAPPVSLWGWFGEAVHDWRLWLKAGGDWGTRRGLWRPGGLQKQGHSLYSRLKSCDSHSQRLDQTEKNTLKVANNWLVMEFFKFIIILPFKCFFSKKRFHFMYLFS